MRITGSKIHRVWKCAGSAALPQIDSEDDGHAPARQRGTAIHAFLERAAAVGGEVALAECTQPELLPLLKALDLDALPTTLATEVAFAWNFRKRTARELGRNLNRDYTGVDYDEEIPCTLDLVGVSGTTGYVGDYKTGHSKLPPPDRYGQTLLGALCARAVYKLDDVTVELIQIHDDGDHHTVRRTVDAWDLDAFAEQVSEAMLRLEFWTEELSAGRAIAVYEGPHCEHCAAYLQCPAKVALVRSIPDELIQMGIRPGVGDEPALVVEPGAITAVKAAAIWMTLERIGDVIHRAKEEICGISLVVGEIPLPDGRVIGPIHTERRVLDGRIASQVLEERYGRKTADEAIELRCTMESLQRAVVKHKAVKDKVQTRDGRGLLDLMLQELYRRGGVKLTTTDTVKAHSPRKRLGSG